MKSSSIIVDTGFWYALINKKDRFHTHALQTLQDINSPLITTWQVLSETCYLLQSRLGQKEMCQFLSSYQQELFQLYEIKPDKLPYLVNLMQKYADLPMDLADASLVLLAEELGHGRILSTDQRDFKTYRWKNHYPFENLLINDTK